MVMASMHCAGPCGPLPYCFSSCWGSTMYFTTVLPRIGTVRFRLFSAVPECSHAPVDRPFRTGWYTKKLLRPQRARAPEICQRRRLPRTLGLPRFALLTRWDARFRRGAVHAQSYPPRGPPRLAGQRGHINTLSARERKGTRTAPDEGWSHLSLPDGRLGSRRYAGRQKRGSSLHFPHSVWGRGGGPLSCFSSFWGSTMYFTVTLLRHPVDRAREASSLSLHFSES
jgi:hypothetical protein